MSHIDTSAHINRWRKKSLAEKALLAVGMLLIAVCVPSWIGDLVVAAIMITATILGAGVPVGLWWKAMTAPIGFLFVAVLTLMFQALTTPAADLTAGLRRLGVPAEIVEMALLMYRFVFLLTDTAESMNAAQAARLGHAGYRRHMKSLSLLIVNLMPRAFARAQALEIGLAARGWRGDLRVLSPVRPASRAWLGAIVAVEAVVLLIGLRTL